MIPLTDSDGTDGAHRVKAQPAPAEHLQPGVNTPSTWPSQDLLRGHKAVSIEHNGTVYRLQSTRAGKLILTK